MKRIWREEFRHCEKFCRSQLTKADDAAIQKYMDRHATLAMT